MEYLAVCNRALIKIKNIKNRESKWIVIQGLIKMFKD